MRKSGLISTLAVLLLAACGEDDAFLDPGAGGGGTGAAATLTVVSSATAIPSDGSAPATITAYVRDANNALLPNIPVSFVATSGGLSPSAVTTDTAGAAATSLSTAGDSTLRTITVTAQVGTTLTATVAVQVVTSSGPGAVQMGNGTGAAFVPGAIAVANANLSAGGSTSLTITLVQSGGALYTGSSVAVTFSSACIAANTAAIQPSTTASTTTGLLTVTYVAQGCSGTDNITATATVNGSALQATGAVTVAQAAIGSIAFISATPSNIALAGTGDATRPEFSTVVFQVRDSSGGPRSGAGVTFSLNTTVGGIALTSTTATSDAQGNVQTVVNAGTVATSVRVTATVTGLPISTQSNQLTVTTGIATDASFSLAVGCFNIEGWNIDGTTTSVTARLGDRFQNPVPDGTPVTFTAEGGNITSTCSTTTTATEGGVCAVSFRSSNPRPSNGRVTLLAKAIGEESFTDSNGNGAFDNGESFVNQSEAFRDDDEDGSYDVGEDFFDFNNNGSRDGPDAFFNGVLCNDTTGRCGPVNTRSTGIGEQNLVILSGSGATINVFDGLGNDVTGQALAMGATNSSKALRFWIRDVNGNIMPGGTTVSLSASGASLGVAQPNSFTVPCSTPTAGTQIGGQTSFNFTVTSGTTTGNGVVTLSVTTPNGLVSTYQISVSNP